MEQMVGEFAPAEFGDKCSRAPRRFGESLFCRKLADPMPDLSRADFPEVEVRGQARGAGDAGLVPMFFIMGKSRAEKVRELGVGSALSRLPRRADSRSPVDSRLEFQGIKFEGSWPFLWRLNG